MEIELLNNILPPPKSLYILHLNGCAPFLKCFFTMETIDFFKIYEENL